MPASSGSQSTSDDTEVEHRSESGSPPLTLGRVRRHSRTETDDDEVDGDINPLASLLGYRYEKLLIFIIFLVRVRP
jgi:hypothetical protein